MMGKLRLMRKVGAWCRRRGMEFRAVGERILSKGVGRREACR